jgi:hypothetical protein
LEIAVAELNRAIPGLGDPDFVNRGPLGGYAIAGWEFEDGAAIERTGLSGEYSSPGAASPVLERTDPVHDLDWETTGLPLEPPFNVRWRGVVYVEEAGAKTLEAETNDPVRILINGTEVYSTIDGPVERNPLTLDPGWHAVDIELEKDGPGGGVELAWVDAEGSRTAVIENTLFPIQDWGGWLHERTLQAVEGGQRFTSHRLDFTPHLASNSVLKATVPAGVQATVVNETYRSVWEPGPGTYAITIRPGSGLMTLRLDDEPVALTPSPDQSSMEAIVTVDAGRHRLEIVQDVPPGSAEGIWSGFDVSLFRLVTTTPMDLLGRGEEGQQVVRVAVPLDVEPY